MNDARQQAGAHVHDAMAVLDVCVPNDHRPSAIPGEAGAANFHRSPGFRR
jgi:hypothetical protein